MREKLLIFEGYDGSGKSTLINAFVDALGPRTCRVIGRKNESSLDIISKAIESPLNNLDNISEVLMRAALEVERLKIIEEAQKTFDVVILDRGVLSAKAWVRYYNLDQNIYDCAFHKVEMALEGATIVQCRCDFETCWRRILEKKQPSRKELLGKEINSNWFEIYNAVSDQFRNTLYKRITFDTSLPLKRTLQQVDRLVSKL